VNKFINYIISLLITSKIVKEINKELSKQNENLYTLLKEEFAIAKDQHAFNKIQSQEILKQLDVLGRMLRGKGFN